VVISYEVGHYGGVEFNKGALEQLLEFGHLLCDSLKLNTQCAEHVYFGVNGLVDSPWGVWFVGSSFSSSEQFGVVYDDTAEEVGVREGGFFVIADYFEWLISNAVEIFADSVDLIFAFVEFVKSRCVFFVFCNCVIEIVQVGL